MVFILSDSLGGETAELVVRAALCQFESSPPAKVRRIPFVADPAHVEEVLCEAEGGINCVLVYTFVLPELRQAVAQGGAKERGLCAVDVMALF